MCLTQRLVFHFSSLSCCSLLVYQNAQGGIGEDCQVSAIGQNNCHVDTIQSVFRSTQIDNSFLSMTYLTFNKMLFSLQTTLSSS